MKSTSPIRSLFLLLFFVFSAAILGDTASEALLLSHFPASVLPSMFLANSLFLFLFSMFLITIIDRLDRGHFFLIALGIHSVCILGIRMIAGNGFTYLYPVLFSYAYITKILTFMIFWTIANDITDAREAKVAFPKIAAGGVLGGLTISFGISFLVKIVKPENLLFLWFAINCVSALLFLPINRTNRKDLQGKPATEKKGISLREDFGMIREEPLLRNMAILYFLMFFLLLNQDFQFYDILRKTFKTIYSDDMLSRNFSSFLGIFRGISISVTFLIQMSLSGYFLRTLGTAKSMFLMPSVFAFVFFTLFSESIFHWMPDGFLAGAGSPFFFSIFGLIVAGVGMRIAMFDSIFSPNFQIFFSSLPKEIRGRGKIFIEGIVKPLAISSAGLFMIFVVNKIPDGHKSGLFLFLALVSVTLIALTTRLKRRYTDSIARYLGGIKAERLSLILDINKAQAGESLLTVLSNALKSDDEDLRSFAIEMLTRFNTSESIKILSDTYAQGDGQLRALIISSLASLKTPTLADMFKNGLSDPDDRVIANSIHALSLLGKPENTVLIKPFVGHANNRVKANALISLWGTVHHSTHQSYRSILEKMVRSASPQDIASGLFAMGEIGDERFMALFSEQFGRLAIAEPQVFAQWVSALGKMDTPAALDLMFRSLSIAKRTQIPLIKRALSQLSRKFEKRFISYLESNDFTIKQAVLEIVLSTELRKKPYIVQQVRKAGLELAADTHRLLSIMLVYFPAERNPSVQVLSDVLYEEWIECAKDCLITIASIFDSSGKIALTGKKLRHKDAHIRANAIEALENLGDESLNRFIIPLFEKGRTKFAALPQGRIWQEHPADMSSFLARILTLSGKWIHDCCIFACYELYLEKHDGRFLQLLGIEPHTPAAAVRHKVAVLL